MLSTTITDTEFATIPEWCKRTGMSRSSAYLAMGRGDLHAIKLGRRTLIHVRSGIAWLNTLPRARIAQPKPVTPAQK